MVARETVINLLLAAAFGVLLALTIFGVSSYYRGKLEEAAAKVAQAEDSAAARGAESAGQAAVTHKVDIAVRQAGAAQAVVISGSKQAYEAHDAQAPLDADRVARIQLVDGKLCAVRPSLNGCAAPPSDAAHGD